MINWVSIIYRLCRTFWPNFILFIIFVMFFTTITPFMVLVYYIRLVYFTYVLYIKKPNNPPSYISYNSSHPFLSLLYYIFWLEPTMRSFKVVLAIKQKNKRTDGFILKELFKSFFKKFIFVTVSGLPIFYLKFIMDIMAVFAKIRPKSLNDLKKCIQVLLAPEM